MTEMRLLFINTAMYLRGNSETNAKGIVKFSMDSSATYLPRHCRRKLENLKTNWAIFDRKTTDLNFGGLLT